MASAPSRAELPRDGELEHRVHEGTVIRRAEVPDQLAAVRNEIAESIAATMLDPSLREQAARAGRAGAPVSVSKPIPQ